MGVGGIFERVYNKQDRRGTYYTVIYVSYQSLYPPLHYIIPPFLSYSRKRCNACHLLLLLLLMVVVVVVIRGCWLYLLTRALATLPEKSMD